jgi:hypothetical protein
MCEGITAKRRQKELLKANLKPTNGCQTTETPQQFQQMQQSQMMRAELQPPEQTVGYMLRHTLKELEAIRNKKEERTSRIRRNQGLGWDRGVLHTTLTMPGTWGRGGIGGKIKRQKLKLQIDSEREIELIASAQKLIACQRLGVSDADNALKLIRVLGPRETEVIARQSLGVPRNSVPIENSGSPDSDKRRSGEPDSLTDSNMPEGFLCPITLETMKDPVIAADGFSYERSAIEDWLSSHHTSPLTNERLVHAYVFPNRNLLQAIETFMQDVGANRPSLLAPTHTQNLEAYQQHLTASGRTCEVCYDNKHCSEFGLTPACCLHEQCICKQCMRQFLQSELHHRGLTDLGSIKCPSCRSEYSYEDVERAWGGGQRSTSVVVGRDGDRQLSAVAATAADPIMARSTDPIMVRYNALLELRENAKSENFLWCTGKGCTARQVHAVSRSGEIMICCACEAKTCAHHQMQWHDGLTCTEYDAQQALRASALTALTADWLQEHTKRCPRCSAHIEKDDGCEHMTCKSVNCGFEFCWQCLEPWRPGMHYANAHLHSDSCLLYRENDGMVAYYGNNLCADVPTAASPAVETATSAMVETATPAAVETATLTATITGIVTRANGSDSEYRPRRRRIIIARRQRHLTRGFRNNQQLVTT